MLQLPEIPFVRFSANIQLITVMRRIPCHTPLCSSPPFGSVREAVSQAASPSMRRERLKFAVSEQPRSMGHLVELQAYPALFRVLAWSEEVLAPVALKALRVLASSWPLPWCWKGNALASSGHDMKFFREAIDTEILKSHLE